MQSRPRLDRMLMLRGMELSKRLAFNQVPVGDMDRGELAACVGILWEELNSLEVALMEQLRKDRELWGHREGMR